MPAQNATAAPAEFLVICLCAEWCGTCRDYRSGFLELAAHFPDTDFVFADIETHDELLGDYDCDVENFPTLLIQRGDDVLFFGTMLPQHAHLKRLIETFAEQTPEESHDYAHRDPNKRDWQGLSIMGHELVRVVKTGQ